MNWVKRHKVISIIVGLIIVGMISSANGTKTPSNGDTSSAGPVAAEKAKLDIASFYAKIQNGMTKTEVIDLAAKDPGSCTESEIQGYGKTEYCSWYGSFGDNAFASIVFKDGNVESKSKTGF